MRKALTAVVLVGAAIAAPMLTSGTAYADTSSTAPIGVSGVYLCYFEKDVIVNWPNSKTPFITAPYVVPASVTTSPAACPPGTIAIGA
jgi:hypothetical protein